jgi:hypothetical protein
VDQVFLISLAERAALKIANIHLLAAGQEARRISKNLQEAALTLTESLDLNVILEKLLDYLDRLVPYDSSPIRASKFRLEEYTKEMLGKNVLEFIAPEDHERAMQNAQRAVEQGQVKNIEYTLLKKTGTRFPAESSISLLTDIAQKPQGFIIITRDITQAKRTDIRLRLLGSAVQQATEAILIMTAGLDSPGPQIVFANPAFYVGLHP